MPMSLEPLHPDGSAGLQFLARTGRAYMFVPLALGTVLSGTIANRIFHDGATLLEFKVEIVGMVACLVALIFAPLVVFQPQLRAARRKGLTEMGALGQRYAREFKQKWMEGLRDPDDPLLGSGDIQSLADMRNSFDVVAEIRLVPFTMKNVTSLAFITLAPLAPLLLTMFSVDQLLDQLLRTLF